MPFIFYQQKSNQYKNSQSIINKLVETFVV